MLGIVLASFISSSFAAAVNKPPITLVAKPKTKNIYKENRKQRILGIQNNEAISLEGIVRLTSKNRYLIVQNKEYLLKTQNELIDRDLSTLQSSDFIALQGVVLKKINSIEVTQIHYVGVSQLLGKWISESNEIFDFVSFFKLTRQALHSHDFKTHSYMLVPESPNRWTLFLSDGDNSHITGYLELKDERLEFVVFNSSDGSIYEKIFLKRYKKEESTFY